MDFDENNLDENNIKKLEAILEKKKKEDENNKTKNNKTKSNKTKNITIQNKEDPQHMTVIFQQVVKLKLPFLIDVSYLNQIDLSENDLIVKKQVKNEKRTSDRVKYYNSRIYAQILEIQKKIENNKELSFLHSGQLGDLIYSLATIKELSKSHKCKLYIQINIQS